MCTTFLLQDSELQQKAQAASVAEIKQCYYCELCNKQYSNCTLYDKHISSFDHTHNQVLSAANWVIFLFNWLDSFNALYYHVCGYFFTHSDPDPVVPLNITHDNTNLY